MTEQHNPDRPPSSFQTHPRAEHPCSRRATSNFVEFSDFGGEPARFDFDRLETWPFPGKDVWHGRGSRRAETLCRVRPAGGGATRWVLIYMEWEKRDEHILSSDELEAHPFYRSASGPPNRELSQAEAAEWLERSWYELPEDLDPAPPFDHTTPARGRLDRDWRSRAPEAQPVEGDSPRVILGKPGEPPLIDGKPKAILTKAQYDVIATLRDARPSALKGDELIERSKHGDARGMLGRLCRDPDWRRVIEVVRTGYRLL